MEQTAVEWLIENSHIIPKTRLNKRELIEQVNKMFEKQIEEAWFDGWIERSETSKQYYNQTFKSE